MSATDRETAAQGYEQLAEIVRAAGGPDVFYEYNMLRARYLRGECDSIPHTVVGFARANNISIR